MAKKEVITPPKGKRLKDMSPEERKQYNKDRAEKRRQALLEERQKEEARIEAEKRAFDKDRELHWLRIWRDATRVDNLVVASRNDVYYINNELSEFKIDYDRETIVIEHWGYNALELSCETLTRQYAETAKVYLENILSSYDAYKQEQKRIKEEAARKEALRKEALIKVGAVLSEEEAAALGLQIKQ